jgi:dipeptidyl aminopeptidase/acylaminoacyl peptidase
MPDFSRILHQQAVELSPTRFSAGVEAFRIAYQSSGLRVIGFIVKPRKIAGKVPLLIYNRGGAENRGLIGTVELSNLLSFWASRGYVVLASQYRGNDGGEGEDTWGGDDVQDVINLVHVGEELPYVDVSRTLMLGASRGGLMTYLAIRHGLNLKAAAVMCGVSNLFDMYRYRGAPMKEILIRLVGDPSSHIDAYVRRSPVFWVEDIKVPLLIVHGAKDVNVPVEQTRILVKKLDELGKDYQYIEYPEAEHDLRRHYSDFLPKIDEFFTERLNGGVRRG